jgi:hypothetical protein
MKPDDFEPKLQRQPLRRVPAEWREEILKAAQPHRLSAGVEVEAVAGWRWFFARFSWGGGAFAVLWIALVSINALLAASDPAVAARPLAAGSFQSLVAGNQHRVALLKLAGDDPAVTTETPSPQSPAVNPHGPRSERRRDGRSGIFRHEPTPVV